MGETPLVSIVTPTKDRAHLLEATLRSVRRQTYPNIEHIVVDGGSSDDTVSVLERYARTYSMRWTSEPDQGMYHAINKGLRNTRGSIVAYLNSDDLYFPWTVDVVVRAFQSRPWADFVYGDALNVDDETGATQIYWLMPFGVDYVRRFRCLLQPAVFWRSEVTARFGYFDESIRLVADCDYWMRAGEAARFAKVSEFLAIERDHAGTLREVTAREAGDPQPRRSEAGFAAELLEVRQRYVSINGLDHQRAVRRYQLWTRIWNKVYGVSFALQSLVPSRIRRGPWSRLLATGQPHISRIRFLLMHVPVVGGSFRNGAIEPSRFWLEPPK